MRPTTTKAKSGSKYFSSTHAAGLGGHFAFTTPKRASFKLAFSAAASVRSSSPARDGPAERESAAALVDNAQLVKINDNLSKLCQSLCGPLDGPDLDESLAYLDRMEQQAQEPEQI